MMSESEKILRTVRKHKYPSLFLRKCKNNIKCQRDIKINEGRRMAVVQKPLYFYEK